LRGKMNDYRGLTRPRLPDGGNRHTRWGRMSAMVVLCTRALNHGAGDCWRRHLRISSESPALWSTFVTATARHAEVDYDLGLLRSTQHISPHISPGHCPFTTKGIRSRQGAGLSLFVYPSRNKSSWLCACPSRSAGSRQVQSLVDHHASDGDGGFAHASPPPLNLLAVELRPRPLRG